MTAQPDKTFTLLEPLDLFAKLEWEWDLLRAFDITKPALEKQYCALNATMTAWHLTDWLCARLQPAHYAKLASHAGEHIDNCKTFRAWVLTNRNMSICEQIAVSAKHYQIQPRAHVLDTKQREYKHADGFSTHYLMVEDHNSLQPIDAVIGYALAFWRMVLQVTGLATAEQVAYPVHKRPVA
jgi:hypothetical protein